MRKLEKREHVYVSASKRLLMGIFLCHFSIPGKDWNGWVLHLFSKKKHCLLQEGKFQRRRMGRGEMGETSVESEAKAVPSVLQEV